MQPAGRDLQDGTPEQQDGEAFDSFPILFAEGCSGPLRCVHPLYEDCNKHSLVTEVIDPPPRHSFNKEETFFSKGHKSFAEVASSTRWVSEEKATLQQKWGILASNRPEADLSGKETGRHSPFLPIGLRSRILCF